MNKKKPRRRPGRDMAGTLTSDTGFDWVQLDDGGWVAAHLLGI